MAAAGNWQKAAWVLRGTDGQALALAGLWDHWKDEKTGNGEGAHLATIPKHLTNTTEMLCFAHELERIQALADQTRGDVPTRKRVAPKGVSERTPVGPADARKRVEDGTY